MLGSRSAKQERYKHEAAASAKERLRNRRLLRGMGLVIALVAMFALGFALRGETTLMARLGFIEPEGTAVVAPSGSASRTAENSLSARIDEVEKLIDEGGTGSYDLDIATDAVLKALSGTIDDTYLQYFDAARYGSYTGESTAQPYAGVGVLFADENGRAYVADVFEGSEAYAEGVQQGDFVVAIDGDRSHEWSVNEAVSAVSRDDGSTVTITWLHPVSAESTKGEEYTTTLTCRVYDEVNVESRLEGSTGVITVKQITQNASDLVNQAVVDLSAQGATSFILDVRNNPGGYLTQAVNIANLFVSSGVLVEIRTADGSSTRNANGTVVTNAPLVVLVNDYTSAAAEVLVAALQDNQRATVVGEPTRGKGSVQVTRELSFGGALRFTAAEYVSPLGHNINGTGVAPDVRLGEGDGGDAQMDYALEAVQSLSRG